MAEKRPVQVDVNAASLDELTTINGIGTVLAQEIINHRPYRTLQDLVNVPGISETRLSALLPFLTLAASKQKAPAKKQADQPPTDKLSAAKFGETEAFVFLEDKNERQDALMIIFGGFILGLIILFLRRSRD